MPSEPPPAPPAAPPPRPGRRLLFRAPSAAISITYLVVLSAALAALIASPAEPIRFLSALGLLFLLPGLGSAVLSVPLATSLGGRFTYRRSVFLSLSGLVLIAPVVLAGAAYDAALPGRSISMAMIFLLAQGPVFWFRHLSLFGVSNPSHARTAPVSILQSLLAMVGLAFFLPYDPPRLAAAAIFLLLAFGTALQLLRAADRPLRREFQTSGVALVRPMLDHINDRDPEATERLEAFFSRFAILANLSVSLVEFRGRSGTKATVVVPTVHPGPFAALGASDLPRKFAEALGPSAGLVLVPHSPCNHELDLPNRAALDRVTAATLQLRSSLSAGPTRAGPLVSPRPGALARAMVLGDGVLVVVSQAPDPTDDIAFAVGDTLRDRARARGDGPLLLVDAHNSYVEDQGDIAYGTSVAARLLQDAEAAAISARAAPVDESPQVGVASRTDYDVKTHGIGPAGIQALAIRTGGITTALVLIDGNNLLQGMREPILRELSHVVQEAEIMTTDNHIVHEVDGSTNPVGERISVGRLAGDCRGLVEAAVRDLEPVEIRTGTAEVPEVPVLGPSWTERLLTSLGDTVSVFGHQAAATLLLLLVGSTVVLVALR